MTRERRLGIRSITTGLLALSIACGSKAQPYSDVTLTLAVSGPGYVLVSGGTEVRCAASCDVTVPRGSEVTLTANSRPGASFLGYSGACSSVGACVTHLDANAEVTAAFNWSPLPPATRYTWKRIDDGVHWTYFVDLDTQGNAYGFGDALVNEFFPVRYDAVAGRVERLPGIDRGEIIAANDCGDVVMYSDQDLIRYRDGAWTVLDTGPDYQVSPRDISDEGWIVGLRYVNSSPHEYVPWLHDGVAARTWGPGLDRVVATAVNNAGQVVGDHAVEELLPGGYAWVNYAVEIRRDGVEELPIGSPSIARDLSDTGLLLGVMRDVGPRAKSYLYDLEAGALAVFEPLDDDLSIFLEHINPSGTMAVGSGTKISGVERQIVLFVNEGRLVDLSSLVELPPNFQLSRLKSVNVHGQILATALVIDEQEGDYWADLILTPE